MKVYNFGDLKRITISESKKIKIYEKKDLRLVSEDGNAYVRPSSDNTSSVGTDIANAKSKNPQDKDFVLNLKDYNGNKQDNTVELNINAKNASDAQKQIEKKTKEPAVNQLMNKTNVTANVRLNNSYIPFTKGEILEMLNRK